MNKTIVAKFGGSTLGGAQGVIRCGQILNHKPEIRLVVVSAFAKVTDRIETLAKAAKLGTFPEDLFLEFSEKHKNIAKELRLNDSFINEDLEDLFSEARRIVQGICYLQDYSRRTLDHLYSLGERLSSSIFFQYCLEKKLDNRQVHKVSAMDLIITSSDFSNALPDIEEIKKNVEVKVSPLLRDNKSLIITEGFIGKNPIGHITTLGREGSDLTATLLGEAVEADEIHLWKNVEGVSSADPNIVKEVETIAEMSYEQCEEISRLGAKVIHPGTLRPASRKNIPIFVRPFYKDELLGTKITHQKSQFFSISTLDAISLITLKNKENRALTLAQSLEIFHRHNIDILSIENFNEKIFFLVQKDKLDESILTDLSHHYEIDQESELSMLNIFSSVENWDFNFDEIKNSQNFKEFNRNLRFKMGHLSGQSQSMIFSQIESESLVSSIHQLIKEKCL